MGCPVGETVKLGQRPEPMTVTSQPLSASPIALIAIEDSDADFDLLVGTLEAAYETVNVRRVTTAGELTSALATPGWDCAVAHLKLPHFSSLDALQIVRKVDPDLPFLIVSGAIGEEMVVVAMRAGADDYIMTDQPGRLVPALKRALEAAAARRARRQAETALQESEARFRALSANLPGMVFQMQLTGAGISLEYVSAGSRRLFGLTPDEVLTNPERVFGPLAPEHAGTLRQQLRQAAANDGDLHWVTSVPGRNGEPPLWVELAASARRVAADRVMWDGIVVDISPQKHAEQRLRDSREELRELASHLVRVREGEREAIAREIHDDMGSALAAVKFDLAALRREFQAMPPLVARLHEAEQHVDAVILSCTRIMHDLRPAILDEGIVAALDWQARSFERRMGIPCTFSSSHEKLDVERDKAIAVFRICQEALNNVAKYAGASRVQIWLYATHNRMALEVRDDGRGIAPSDIAKTACFGLRGMRERAYSLGGTISIEGEPDHGTVIAVSLPLVLGEKATNQRIRTKP